MTKCRAYQHEKLNTSKGVIRRRELALATEDEMASALGKQGVTNIKRISIRKGEERIQTNTYILTFNKSQTPKEVKIGYGLERVEHYVPAPLRCFKCQKFGHHREAYRGRQTCSKCCEKNPNYAEEDCLKEITCGNCQQDHPAYARTCTDDQKEKEIVEIKHKRNVSFLEARRIVGSYIGESSYASGGWIEPMTTPNIEHLGRYWTSWKPMIGQSFRTTWKNYTRLNFTKHQLSNKLRMGRDPML